MRPASIRALLTVLVPQLYETYWKYWSVGETGGGMSGLNDPEHPTLRVNTSNCADDHPPNGRVPHFARSEFPDKMSRKGD
jgi:hypothetical protein